MSAKKKKFSKKMKRMACLPASWILMLCAVLIRRLTRERTISLSSSIGNFVYDHLRIRRSMVLSNLKNTFPEKTNLEIEHIARESYHSQVLNLLEMLRIPLIKDARNAREFVSLKACDSFHEVLRNNQGAVVVSGHYCSWEIIGVCTGLLLKPMNFVVKPIKNRYLDKYISSLRTFHGNRVIPKDKALRQGMKALKNGEILVILADQSQRKVDQYIEFLRRRSSVFLGPAFLALKAGVPLFVELSRRNSHGHYELEIIEVQTSDLQCVKEDILELVKRYHKVMEDFILHYPGEWLWMHNRWKRSNQLPLKDF
ncbi:lysophospholipid acyltransferase family protein [Desulfonatronovibrio magnus]|uniref:lysophospholipid acyltransferase family protein n=1 Tax=Desulfonatronovibrio magnus TaxID=698827 RepID=UPI000AA6CF38|nr:lysophospholipid acyltransferase family protein [Desulfonatronovibrio magnus]